MALGRLASAFVIALAAAAAPVHAETSPGQPRSLVDLEVRDKDLQVGMLTRFTRIARTNAVLAGGALELIFNDSLGLGVSHLSLANDLQPDYAAEPLSISQTSVMIDLIAGATRPWYGRFAIGIGALVVSGRDLDGEDVAARGTTFEPELAWGLNLFPHVRVNFGWSYRFAIMPGDSLVSSKQLTGANGLVALALGLD